MGRLLAENGTFAGTAWFISPRTALTAKHCTGGISRFKIEIVGHVVAVDVTSRHPTQDIAVLTVANGADESLTEDWVVPLTERLPRESEVVRLRGFPNSLALVNGLQMSGTVAALDETVSGTGTGLSCSRTWASRPRERR